MGLVHTELQLSNAREPRLAPMVVSALADTGALHLCIPAHVALQLELEELERREVTPADGARHLVPYVGPLTVRFGNRTCFTGAMVLGDEVGGQDDAIAGRAYLEAQVDVVERDLESDLVEAAHLLEGAAQIFARIALIAAEDLPIGARDPGRRAGPTLRTACPRAAAPATASAAAAPATDAPPTAD